MSDSKVLMAQQWLNQTYGGRTGYGSNITEDGLTGWGTINAMIRALQIELGISSTANNFGPSTVSRFNTRFPNGIIEQSLEDTTEDNIYGIIQCACWCKGYAADYYGITKHFYSETGNSIKQLKQEAGCSEISSTITLNVMKALLSMDQFKLVIGGNSNIRIMQQKLNNKYEDYIGLIQCDGVYGRQMNNALIIALQKIEGYSKGAATGNFGDGTKSKLPIVPSYGQLTSQVENAAIELIRYALYCNGYTSVNISAEGWDSNLSAIIQEFQYDMLLEQIDQCNTDTWMALLLSKGNPDRAYNAIDTAYTIYSNYLEEPKNRIELLKNNGINLVGRYISGEEGKQIKLDELPKMIENGINFYPIFQRDGKPSAVYFTAYQAKLDAEYAYHRARTFRIPENSIIYFAVDIDLVDSEVTNYALPYFQALKQNLSRYKIGVYGTRNVCSRIMEHGYAVTCLVSDASTGYSGNMGFKMPSNWNIDQFAVDVPLGDMLIDKNIYSGKFPIVTYLSPRDYYYGKTQVKGTSSGYSLYYSGEKLKLNVTATGLDGNPIDDLYVIVNVSSSSSYPNPKYSDGKVIAKVDGNTYDLTTEQILDQSGQPTQRDSIFISETNDYILHYGVCRKTSDNTYETVDNIPVLVEVEISTYSS